ncbi:hypothetical protein CIB93_08330 [Streptomyces sp. WZ.A104]|nr:hypothetical protein CIB93_08330 [Streptomyces sp. WZ.A104]
MPPDGLVAAAQAAVDVPTAAWAAEPAWGSPSPSGGTRSGHSECPHVEGTHLADPAPGPAGRGGGFRVLYDAGYEIDRTREELFARSATPDEVKPLQSPSGEAVVELHRTAFTAGGTAVEFAIGVHAASRFRWTYDFAVPDSARKQGNAS